MSKINEIIDFFGYMSDLTEHYITSIEVRPIRIKENLYVTGLRRRGLGIVEVHLKDIKKVQLALDGYEMEYPLKQEPDGDLWIEADMLANTTLTTLFNYVKNKFLSLKEFTVAELMYRLKTRSSSDYVMKEEVTVYEDKRLACREVITKRRGCESFKSKFHHFGGTAQQEKKINDLEFAESELC